MLILKQLKVQDNTLWVMRFLQILQSFESEPSFEENGKAMIKVLESISKRMINDQNESFALKVFYLSYLIQQSLDQGIKSLTKR